MDPAPSTSFFALLASFSAIAPKVGKYQSAATSLSWLTTDDFYCVRLHKLQILGNQPGRDWESPSGAWLYHFGIEGHAIGTYNFKQVITTDARNTKGHLYRA
jgi:hypothetical protein